MSIQEHVLARQFAFARFGATRFECPRCGHDEGRQLRSRPRVWQCRNRHCRAQRSVLSGTPFQATKLPLDAILDRLDRFDLGEVVRSTELAARHGIARSSAWHLNQRVMAALQADYPPWDEVPQPTLFAFPIRCRRPQPTPRVHPDSPAGVRRRRARWLRREAKPPFLTEVCIQVGMRYHTLRSTVPGERREPTEPIRHPQRFWGRISPDRALRNYLNHEHRSVSLRWLGRYVAHYLAMWNSRIPLGPLSVRVPALQMALAHPALPLHRLRPHAQPERYLDPVSPPPPQPRPPRPILMPGIRRPQRSPP